MAKREENPLARFTDAEIHAEEKRRNPPPPNPQAPTMKETRRTRVTCICGAKARCSGDYECCINDEP